MALGNAWVTVASRTTASSFWTSPSPFWRAWVVCRRGRRWGVELFANTAKSLPVAPRDFAARPLATGDWPPVLRPTALLPGTSSHYPGAVGGSRSLPAQERPPAVVQVAEADGDLDRPHLDPAQAGIGRVQLGRRPEGSQALYPASVVPYVRRHQRPRHAPHLGQGRLHVGEVEHQTGHHDVERAASQGQGLGAGDGADRLWQ